MKAKLTLLVATTIVVSACATFKLTTGGEKVRVLEPNEVSSCKQMGKTNAAVPARFIFERSVASMEKELRVVARNSAAGMGGDTIVPLTVIEGGKQSFVVYKCVNPDG